MVHTTQEPDHEVWSQTPCRGVPRVEFILECAQEPHHPASAADAVCCCFAVPYRDGL
jgi:hypothetical protein